MKGVNLKDSQMICGSSPTVHPTNTTKYYGQGVGAWSSSELMLQNQVPFACRLSRLYVGLDGAAGAGETYIITVRVEGGDTAITCTIGGGADTLGDDLVNNAPVTQGQYVTIKVVSSAPATARRLRWSLRMTRIR